jgi:hypothetical protein
MSTFVEACCAAKNSGGGKVLDTHRPYSEYRVDADGQVYFDWIVGERAIFGNDWYFESLDNPVQPSSLLTEKQETEAQTKTLRVKSPLLGLFYRAIAEKSDVVEIDCECDPKTNDCYVVLRYKGEHTWNFVCPDCGSPVDLQMFYCDGCFSKRVNKTSQKGEK